MIPVILDAKRGDIASTAEAYAKSAFETLGAHCITFSPYLGKDSIDPFLRYPEKGVFLLCKTSNAGAAICKIYGDWPMVTPSRQSTVNVLRMNHVAQLAQTWNTKNNIGLVVGATHLDALTTRPRRCAGPVVPRPGVGDAGRGIGSQR